MKHRFLAVVDDDPAIRRVITFALSLVGYAAEEFGDGREFLDRHHPATSGVILGMCMPVLDGFGTLSAMQERCMGLPVITMSGSMHMDDADIARFGAAEFVAKPFRVEKFLAAVTRVMGPPVKPK